jgi:hypothetical protein
VKRFTRYAISFPLVQLLGPVRDAEALVGPALLLRTVFPSAACSASATWKAAALRIGRNDRLTVDPAARPHCRPAPTDPAVRILGGYCDQLEAGARCKNRSIRRKPILCGVVGAEGFEPRAINSICLFLFEAYRDMCVATCVTTGSLDTIRQHSAFLWRQRSATEISPELLVKDTAHADVGGWN